MWGPEGDNYEDADAIDAVLREVRPSVVIHGAVRGADTLAGEWAEANGVPVIPRQAERETLPVAPPGRSATGSVRQICDTSSHASDNGLTAR